MTPRFHFTLRRSLTIAPIGLTALMMLVLARPTSAADPPARQPATGDNAALAYWQAFAAMPSDEAQVAIIDDWDKVPLDADAVQAIESSAYALSELRRGARMSRCDWGMDYSRGPELLMPHLAKARQLARAAMLRARHRFEQGKPRDGVADTLAAMKLGHDVGADPILISILVQYAIEDMSIELLAQNLPKLSPEELDQLAQTLAKMPTGDRIADVWATESRFMIDWFEERLEQAAEGGAGGWEARVLSMPVFDDAAREKLKAGGVPPLETLREQLETIRAYYRDLAKVTGLAPTEQGAAVSELESKAPDNLLARTLLPTVGRVFHVRHRAQVKSAMLRAAVAVQRGGPERLEEPALADPFGEGPFEYRKTDGGFELVSKLTTENGPVSLAVGSSSPH